MKIVTPSTRFQHPIRIAVLAAMFAFTTGLKAVVIDGNVQAGEGWTGSYDVTFNVQNYATNPVPGGKLYYYQSGNVLAFGLITPTEIDDNLYGNPDGSGQNSNSFGDLTGSDQWVMKIMTAGGTRKQIGIDYLLGSSPYTASAFSGEGSTDAIYNGTNVLKVASSMQYNLVNFPTATTNSVASNSLWIDNIMYEWQIDFTTIAAANRFTLADVLATFAGDTTTSSSYNYLHMSPNELGKNVVAPNPPTGSPPVGTPEGGNTATLLGLALFVLGALSRKLRKA